MCLYPQIIYLYNDPDDGHITSTMNVREANKFGGWRQEVPCGGCPECIHERKRMKGIQAFCESKSWRKNCFITLTYSDEHMPDDYSIHWSAVQLFLARLRKRFKGDMAVFYDGKWRKPIRSFGCGEYGDLAMVLPGLCCKLGRPHFHIILFNFDFDDKYLWRYEECRPIFRSPTLEKLWPFGNSEIEDVAVGACMYVAGYVEKKKHNKNRNDYSVFDIQTGEVVYEREPEQSHGSNRPGLGYFFLQKFKGDIVRNDFVMTDPGRKNKLPKYFDKKLLVDDEFNFMHLLNKAIRVERAKSVHKEEDWLRIMQREDFLYALANSKKNMKGTKL